MSKLKAPLFSLDAVRRLGNTLTFRRSRGQNIVETSPDPPDAKSLAQLSWRHMYLKAVALWHALSAPEKQTWEIQARRRHMTGFAWFMSQALKPNPGLYLPLQGGIMAGDIDMASNLIKNLLDPTLPQHPDTLASRQAAIAAHAGLATVHQDAPALIAAHAAFPNVHHTPPAGTFISHTDTPGSYAGQALKGVRVNAATNALEFATITGGYTEGARAYHNVEQSIPNNTWTWLPFNSERYDTDTIHDNTVNNSRLTCKTAGKYVIIFHCIWDTNATGDRHAEIQVNRTQEIVWDGRCPTGSVQVANMLSTVYPLEVGDYIEVIIRQRSGGALGLLYHAQMTPEFMMQRIG